MANEEDQIQPIDLETVACGGKCEKECKTIGKVSAGY